MPGPEADRPRTAARRRLMVVGVLALAAVLVLLSLDRALERVPAAGEPAGGFTSVASPSALRDPDGAVAVVAGWVGGADEGTGLTSSQIVRRYCVVDVLFAVTLALLVTALLRPASRPLAPREQSNIVLRLLAPLAVAYLLADWSETVYLAWVWDRPPDGAALTAPGTEAMRLVGLLSTLKWIALLSCLVVGVARRVRRGS